MKMTLKFTCKACGEKLTDQGEIGFHANYNEDFTIKSVSEWFAVCKPHSTRYMNHWHTLRDFQETETVWDLVYGYENWVIDKDKNVTFLEATKFLDFILDNMVEYKKVTK